MSNAYLTAIIVEELIPAIVGLKDEIVELKKEIKEIKEGKQGEAKKYDGTYGEYLLL